MSFAEYAASDTGNTSYTRVDGNTLPIPEMSYGSGASYQPHEGNHDAYDRAFSELTDAIRAYQEHINGISRFLESWGAGKTPAICATISTCTWTKAAIV